MNPRDYLRLQLRLEGMDILHEDLLRQVEVMPGENKPLMIIALLVNRKQVTYYAESLPSKLLEELIEYSSGVRFPKVGSIFQFLGSRGFTLAVGHYKTYVVPECYSNIVFEDVRKYSRSDSKVQAFGFDDLAKDVYAIERDGKIVSACVSTREDQFCGEAWVCTDPEYRGKRLAQNVVGAWARSLILANKIPFYSHDIGNTSSANLARRLKLQPVFEEINISYMNV